MNSTIIITLIICVTIIIVTALCLFAPKKGDDSQKLRDIRKIIIDFSDNYMFYDDANNTWECKASGTIIHSTFRLIDRIS